MGCPAAQQLPWCSPENCISIDSEPIALTAGHDLSSDLSLELALASVWQGSLVDRGLGPRFLRAFMVTLTLGWRRAVRMGHDVVWKSIWAPHNNPLFSKALDPTSAKTADALRSREDLEASCWREVIFGAHDFL